MFKKLHWRDAGLVIALMLSVCSAIDAQTLPIVQTTPGTYNFVATGNTTVAVECWGAGGAGGSATGAGAGNAGGGGGGGYSKSVVTLVAGQSYQYKVGSGTTGGDFSRFLNSTTSTILVLANGGSNAPNNGPAGAGAAIGIGSIRYPGGTGATGGANFGGGGGSSAGSSANGTTALGNTGAVAPVNGGNGGDGGSGASNDVGDAGSVPGGGGGGGHKTTTTGGNVTGGAGANGRIMITLACVATTFSSCPSPIMTNNDPDDCSAVVSYSAVATGTPAPTYSYIFSGATSGSGSGTGSGSTFEVGTTFVTVTSQNGCGTDECSFQVTVVDNMPPAIEPLASNQTVECDGSGNTDDFNDWLMSNGGASATDNCGDVSWSYEIIDSNSDCGGTGSTMVTFTATDVNGNSSQTTATFIIEDTTPPTASCQNITIYYDEDGHAEISADDVDNGSSDICGSVSLSLSQAAFDCTDLGANSVVLTVTDECGLSSTCEAVVTVTIPNAWRCGNNLDKVTICHLPPQYPAQNPQTLCVSLDVETLCNHLGHPHAPDHLGACTEADFPRAGVNQHVSNGSTQESIVDLQSITLRGSTPGTKHMDVYCAPNPFSDVTTINVRLDLNELLTIKVLDCMGKLVSEVFSGDLERGQHRFNFDCKGFAEGLYYLTITSGKETRTQTMVVIR